MEDLRSKSCGKEMMEVEVHGGRGPAPSGLHELRCYSGTYVPSRKELGKRAGIGSSSSSRGGWSLSDPELQRKKRVASYKVYAVEGKVKGSFRKSFRWLKDRYTQVVYGWP